MRVPRTALAAPGWCRGASGSVAGLCLALAALACVTEPASPRRRLAESVPVNTDGFEQSTLQSTALRTNVLESVDGRLTKFYYFRPGQGAAMRAVLVRAIDDLARPDVQVSEQ